jgi:hypothetical protein
MEGRDLPHHGFDLGSLAWLWVEPADVERHPRTVNGPLTSQ